MNFEIIHKPTFTNQLLVIPKEQIGQILQKIEFLRTDPAPQGNLKKKLHGYKGDVYRLRSGDYRIVYTYGDGWVALLGVDNRKDIYKNTKLVADPASIAIGNLPRIEDILDLEETPSAPSAKAATEAATVVRLPVPMTEELLAHLRIDEQHFAALARCRTVDDLLSADVPAEIQNAIFDAVMSPNFDYVLAQPSYLTGSTDNLLRFKEGELLGFLLKLDPEQEKYVTWAINAAGATLLKGAPGTGKSTVALYRVRALIETLKKHGVAEPRILFTTYTNALVAFSQQLLANLLGEAFKHVQVKTADSVARELVARHGQTINFASNSDLRRLILKARAEAINSFSGNALQRQARTQILNRLTPDYLIAEINSVIEGRGITTPKGYLDTPRAGRSIAFNKTQRTAVWELRENFYRLLEAENLHTWSQIRTRGLESASHIDPAQLYDAVVIDEAQDLEPNALAMLVSLCCRPNRLFVTADANQTIYGGSFNWMEVHENLKFKGRTGVLKVNYRTTREISEAAHDFAASSLRDSEQPDRFYLHNGPQPSVRAVSSLHDEAELLARFFNVAARDFRLGLGACACIVPSEKTGKEIAGRLTHLGIEAEYMTGKTLDLNRAVTKVITLMSAKGLEFPIVALAGFLESSFPVIPTGTPEEALDEIQERARLQLYVGMTRAMRALLVVAPAETSSGNSVLINFNSQFWNLGANNS